MAASIASQAPRLDKLLVVKTKKSWILAYPGDLGLKTTMTKASFPQGKEEVHETSPKPIKTFTPFSIDDILATKNKTVGK